MAINMTPYVKFRRGTPAMYAALATKDADSLYFISEKGASSGLLYLGDKLISGNISYNNTLSDLDDILLSEGITPNSLLIFDGDQQKWVNKPFSEIFNDIVGGEIFEMEGATATVDGSGGTVPAPRAGDDIKFLRGDAQWVTISQFTASDAAKLNHVVQDVSTILGDDYNMSMREVAASEITKLFASAPENLNSLDKITDKLQEHDAQLISLDNRVTIIENAAIGDLAAELEALRNADNYLQLEIDDLDSRLKWRKVNSEEEEE